MATLLLLLFSLTFTEIVPWTVDLPEVRQYFFEKGKNPKNVINIDNQREKFDNINSDSPHNSHYPTNYESKMPYENQNSRRENDNDVYGERYADDYRDQSYMTKKVSGVKLHFDILKLKSKNIFFVWNPHIDQTVGTTHS